MEIKISKDPNEMIIQKTHDGFCLAGQLGRTLWYIDVTFNTHYKRWNNPVLYYQGVGTTHISPISTNLTVTVAEVYQFITCNPDLRIVYADDTVHEYIASMVIMHGSNWIIERLRRFNLTHRH